MNKLDDLISRRKKIGSIGAIDFLLDYEKRKSSNKTLKMNSVHIAMISDDGYVMPTSVAIHSLRKSKKNSTRYEIHIISSEMSRSNIEFLESQSSDDVNISVFKPKFDLSNIKLKNANSAILSATPAALYKFAFGIVFSELERVIYIDGDLIVNDDLTDLFGIDLDGYPLAAVPDSGQIYYKHAMVRSVDKYFNSGVMLIDCKKFRDNNYYDDLVKAKNEIENSLLMDQDAFNRVFDKNYFILPIRYNFLHVNLNRAKGKYSIEDINSLYGTEYSDFHQIVDDAAIIHFSSKDKPWKCSQEILGRPWYEVQNDLFKYRRRSVRPVKISVIIPIFNCEDYLEECLHSVLNQDEQSIEVICVVDGASDGSWKILEDIALCDKRVHVLYQENRGQSSARNHALKYAVGDFVYFIDSDDLLKPGALSICYQECVANNLDIVYFDADAFFENDDLKKEYSHYETYYLQKGEYDGVMSGKDALGLMVKYRDYRPAPVLQFLRRDFMMNNFINFKNGIIHEDNLFTFRAILCAARVKKIPEILYSRRVRPGSTMTSKNYLRSYRGYMNCFLEMSKYSDVVDASPETESAIIYQISGMLKNANKAAKMINQKDQSEELTLQDRMFLKIFSGEFK